MDTKFNAKHPQSIYDVFKTEEVVLTDRRTGKPPRIADYTPAAKNTLKTRQFASIVVREVR
jgi:hypothetical protein